MPDNEKRHDDLQAQIAHIRDNHLFHIAQDLTTVVNDVQWLKKFFWLVAAASVTSTVGTIFTLISNNL